MLFSSSESSCPGKMDGVFDFILKLAEMAEWPLFLKFMHHELRNYRAEKNKILASFSVQWKVKDSIRADS